MENEKKAYIFALLVVLFWATVASAFKITLRYLNFIQLVFWSSLSSTIVLFLIFLFEGRIKTFITTFKKGWLNSLFLGFLNPFLYYLVLFKAYSLLPAQQAQPLNQTWAIILAFLSAIILKQKVGLKSIIALFISFSGVLLISTRGELTTLKFSSVPGVLLALGSAFIWAFYWIFNLKDPRDPIVKLLTNFVFGTFYILVSMLIVKEKFIPNLYGIIGGIYIGIFEMGISFYFWLKALSLSRTTVKISNMIYLVPFLSLIVIRLTVGEKILSATVFGLILIIVGIFIQQYNFDQRKKTNNRILDNK
ncbi:MAG: DMT family transporter [candidate division WOR-3 bacterium]